MTYSTTSDRPLVLHREVKTSEARNLVYKIQKQDYVTKLYDHKGYNVYVQRKKHKNELLTLVTL